MFRNCVLPLPPYFYKWNEMHEWCLGHDSARQGYYTRWSITRANEICIFCIRCKVVIIITPGCVCGCVCTCVCEGEVFRGCVWLFWRFEFCFHHICEYVAMKSEVSWFSFLRELLILKVLTDLTNAHKLFSPKTKLQ